MLLSTSLPSLQNTIFLHGDLSSPEKIPDMHARPRIRRRPTSPMAKYQVGPGLGENRLSETTRWPWPPQDGLVRHSCSGSGINPSSLKTLGFCANAELLLMTGAWDHMLGLCYKITQGVRKAKQAVTYEAGTH